MGEDPHIQGSSERPPLVRLAVIFYGALLAVACIWVAVAGRPAGFASAAAAARGVSPLRDLGAGVLAGLIVVALSHEFTLRTRAGAELARVLGAALGPLSTRQCLALALLSGVAEEALFRAALQPDVGFVAASLLFGLAHFAPRRELAPWTLFAVAAGLLFGALFDATGNLVAPCVAHFLVNAINLRRLAPRPPAE